MDGAAFQTFISTATAWLVTAVPNLVTAIILLIAGYLVAGWVARLVTTVLASRANIDQTLTPVIATILRSGIIIVTIVAVLGQLGVQIASILAVLGAAGLAIGLALQGTLSNIAAGIMLLWLRPFRAGESIETKDTNGVVTEVGLFATTVRTGDGSFHFVPNSSLWNTPIRNTTRNPIRRVEVVVGIDYGDDISKGRDVLIGLMRTDPRVKSVPEPQVLVTGLTDKAVNLTMRCWVASTEHGRVTADMTERAKIALDRAGMYAPYPRHVVRDAEPATELEPSPV
jgi:small conductance mechanosensitive channel